MRLGNRLAVGFDHANILCIGLHVHSGSVALDFFGFYLNAYVGPVCDDEPQE